MTTNCLGFCTAGKDFAAHGFGSALILRIKSVFQYRNSSNTKTSPESLPAARIFSLHLLRRFKMIDFYFILIRWTDALLEG